MILICNSPRCNGQAIPYILIDGYIVGDTLLEGVMFMVSFDSKNKAKVEVDPSCYDYFENLNKSKWYKRVEDILESMMNKKDYTYATCSICNQEEYVDIK